MYYTVYTYNFLIEFFFFEKEHCNFIDDKLNQLQLQKIGVEEHPLSTPKTH